MLVRIPADREREREREGKRGGEFPGLFKASFKNCHPEGKFSVPLDSKMAQTLPLLLLAVLNTLSCHSEVRARDPDVEEEEAVGTGERTQHISGTFGSTHLPLTPSEGKTHNSVSTTKETVHPIAQRGNWCAYVNHRMVTIAVLCTTETVKSVKPCSDGAPDCQIITQSSLPVYKQKQIALSSMHWTCCPGYGGHNCLEKDRPPEDETHALKSEINDNGSSGGEMGTDQLGDAKWADKHVQEAPIHGYSPNKSAAGDREGMPTSQPLPFLDSSILLSIHQLMSTMMSQLQPVLESFNQTLKHLSSEVEALSQDLQQVRMKQEHRPMTRVEDLNESIEQRLENSHLQISQMKNQLDTQKGQFERAFQIQQELLRNNLTKLKEEMDDHFSQSQDAQVNLQALTALVEEVRLGQKKLEGALQRERAEFVNPNGGQPTQESVVWQAITRLDEKAQSNSAKLSSLSATSKNSDGAVRVLQRDLLDLGQSLEEVKQRVEVHFAETGLEVEATRVRALNSVDELTANVSAHEGQLREIELDLDNIYQLLQRNDSAVAEQAYSCKSIGSSLTRLALEVANVTQLSKQNQLALEEMELERNQVTKMEDLHQGLLNIKESLAFEQGRSRSLQDNMSQLKASLLDSQQEIRGLRQRDKDKSNEIQGLSAAFTALLNDAIRHSDVLEVLLGEEVLEFTHWSHTQKKELSIPGLLQKMNVMQQKIETHDRILASLKRKHPDGDEMNSDDPVAYLGGAGTNNQVRGPESYQTSLLDTLTGEEDVDYSVSDFWSLGKEVEQLAGRITMLEERCGNCTAPPGGSVVELQADIASLRQNLEDHLRMFQKLFSNTEELISSTRNLNLEDVWRLVRKKEGKRRRGSLKQEERIKKEEKSSSARSKRYSEREHAWLPHSTVVFITSLDYRTGPNGELKSKNVAINYGGTFNPTLGVFQAPETGLYLFLVTLDFERGLSLAVLKRSGVPVASLRQEQREKRGPVSRASLLELRQGETVTLELMHGSLRKAQPGDNTLSGLLLFITEQGDML
ncbi:multimerin-2 isoform X2 [Puntigrus tetrazona]|uniref:multimerin-2 isoform X2 n=1 Tax=Puntigrus tetrazona TaxID=1606681 RepID=UPI001C891BF4|nr:multimerin-2 isoform X2 [Puntigrus tetrazona]